MRYIRQVVNSPARWGSFSTEIPDLDGQILLNDPIDRAVLTANTLKFYSITL